MPVVTFTIEHLLKIGIIVHRCLFALFVAFAPDVPSTIVRFAGYYENLINHEIMKPKKNENGEFVIGT